MSVTTIFVAPSIKILMEKKKKKPTQTIFVPVRSYTKTNFPNFATVPKRIPQQFTFLTLFHALFKFNSLKK